jgi:hypothetical protein
VTESQLTRADLAAMTPEQIDRARTEGLLDDLLGRSHIAPTSTPDVPPGPGSADQGSHGPGATFVDLTRADLKGMSPAEVLAAYRRGQLDAELGRP